MSQHGLETSVDDFRPKATIRHGQRKTSLSVTGGYDGSLGVLSGLSAVRLRLGVSSVARILIAVKTSYRRATLGAKFQTS